jgi:hypothetical protein
MISSHFSTPYFASIQALRMPCRRSMVVRLLSVVEAVARVVGRTVRPGVAVPPGRMAMVGPTCQGVDKAARNDAEAVLKRRHERGKGGRRWDLRQLCPTS